MKVSVVQMNMRSLAGKENFDRAEALIRRAARETAPDVILLPETWNTGFFPRENLESLCDRDGERVKKEIGGLAKEFRTNIVAGSAANVKNGKIYNTAYVFDRDGNTVAEYDKTHLFTPMGEHEFFEKGSRAVRFELDGKKCGLLICYDIRFPELTRTMTVHGVDFLFVVSQWPTARVTHLEALVTARAIENQTFAICCNSCGTAGDTVFAGHSRIIDPWGETIASAESEETIITADCDESILDGIRRSINVFADRREDIYDIKK